MLRRALLPALAAAALAAVLVLAPSRAAPTPSDPTTPAAARTAAARAAYDAARAAAAAGVTATDAVYTWSVRWLTAEVEGGGRARAACRAHLKRMQELEANVTRQFKAGAVRQLDVHACAYYRAEAEVWAARGTLR